MNYRVRMLLASGIAAAVLALFILLFLLVFEKKTITVHSGGKSELLRDDYSALQRLLESRDYSVDRFSPDADFWNSDYSLAITGPGFLERLDDDDVVGVIDWMESYGGSLLVVGLDLAEEDYAGTPAQRLLDRCGILTDGTQEPRYLEGTDGTMTIAGREGDLFISWKPGFAIPLDPEFPFETKGMSGSDVRWIQAAVGEYGLVAFCSDPGFFSNAGLTETGHAAMLQWLVREADYDLQIGLEDTGLREAAARFPWGKILVPLAVFCGFLIWAKAPTFGPIRQAAREDRRSIAERFLSEGGFLWARAPTGTLERMMRKSERSRRLREGSKKAWIPGENANRDKAPEPGPAAKPLGAKEFVAFMNESALREAGGQSVVIYNEEGSGKS